MSLIPENKVNSFVPHLVVPIFVLVVRFLFMKFSALVAKVETFDPQNSLRKLIKVDKKIVFGTNFILFFIFLGNFLTLHPVLRLGPCFHNR